MTIIITADGLYVNHTVIDICKTNGWDYIIRYKEGCASSIAKEYQALPEKENCGKTNTNDVVKVTDSAKQVADKFNLNYDNVTVNYYFIDGYTDPSGGTIRVHLKDAVEKTERQKDIISLCEYFKTASDDGKVYSNQDMSKEFNSAVVLDVLS